MNQFIQSSPVSTTISIAEVMRGIWQRKKLVTIITSLAMLTAFAFVMTAEPRYTTEAHVLIENLETPFDQTPTLGVPDTRALIDERAVQSQVSVISSNDLAERVIEALQLKNRKEFDGNEKGGIVSSIFAMIGLSSDSGSQTAAQRAVIKFNDGLSAWVLPNSNVIGIKYTSQDPQTAAEIANTLAESYVMSTREAQLVPTGRAKDWLGEQIEALRKKVVESEVAAEEFRARAGLIKGTETTLGAQNLSELNTQITAAEAAKSEAQARAQSIRDLLRTKGSVDTSADVTGNPLIQRLREQQVAIQRSIDELSATYLPGHPKMVSARTQLANVNKLIRSEALKIVGGLEEQAKVAAAREKSLRESLEELKAGASVANLDDVKLRALEREAAANRTLLESLLGRYSDAAARQDVVAQPGMARIIQRAAIPVSVSFPKRGPIVLLSTLAGLALSLGLAFLVEIMAAAERAGQAPAPVKAEPPAPVQSAPPVAARAAPPITPPAAPPRATTPNAPPARAVHPARPVPVQRTAPPPPAARPDGAALAQSLAAATAIPQMDDYIPKTAAPSAPLPTLMELPSSPDFRTAWTHAGSVLSQAPSSYTDAMRRITHWASSVRDNAGVKRLAAVSAEFNGLDLCAMTAAAARQAAAMDARVIVIDAALGPAALDPIFGADSGPGLAELLSGQADFTDVIVRDQASGVHFLRWGGTPRGGDAAIPARMGLVLEALESAYDLILVHVGEISARNLPLVQLCGAAVLLSASANMVDAARLMQDLRLKGVAHLQCVRVSPALMKAQPAA